jgi:hypothetical protein
MGGDPGAVVLFGDDVVELGLEPVPGRRDRGLPVEERDGSFQAARR